MRTSIKAIALLTATGRLNESIELLANAEYDLDAEDDKLSYLVGVRYKIQPDLDVSFKVGFHDKGESLRYQAIASRVALCDSLFTTG